MSRFRFRPTLEEIENRSVPSAVTSDLAGSLVLNNSPLTVSGVPVTLSGNSTGGIPVNASAVSNSTGQFTFQNVLPGTYSLTAGSAPGVVGTTTPRTVTITSGSNPPVVLSYTGGLGPTVLSIRSFLNIPNIAPLQFPTGGTGTAQAAVRSDDAPVAVQIANKTVAANHAQDLIGLADKFTDADTTNSEVTFEIVSGNTPGTLKLTTLDKTAPQTVANFLDYVNAGDYDSALFTRNVANFVLQGGGSKIDTTGTQITPTNIRPPVENEFSGVSNLKNTVSMALSGNNPDSGTNQFFINTGNNASLDSQLFTVFAKVEDPSSLVALSVLAATPTLDVSTKRDANNNVVYQKDPNGNDIVNPDGTKNPVQSAVAMANQSTLLDNLPLQNYSGVEKDFPTGATRANYTYITHASVTRQDEALTYSATASNPASSPTLVAATVQGSKLLLTYGVGQTGTATITVRATDKFGIFTEQSFDVTVS